MEPRDRLIAEHTQLSDRLAKLNHVLVAGGKPVSTSEQQANLTTEQNELSARLTALNQVLGSVNLPDQQTALMIAQAFVMQDYLDILEKRIALP